MADPPAPATSFRNTALNLIFAIAGGALLYVTVQRVGWTDVQASVTAIGWWYLGVLMLGGLRFAARSMAWTVCAQPEHLSLSDAFRASLAGDALGNMTPLGVFASEPAKMLLVRNRIPVVTAVASVAAENAFYMASVLVMIGAGALAFFSVASVVPVLGTFARIAGALATVTGRHATSVDRLREIEVHFYALLTWPMARIARVLLWEALFHLGAVAEVFLVLQVIASGATLLDAFILETTGRLIVVVFKFVPYRLGVDEAGTALVANALRLNPTVGVTLALVRRIRILIWNAVGLLLLVVRRA
jgi:hypothetical protein